MKRNLLLIALLCFSFGLQAQYWSQQNTNMAGTSTGVDQVSIVDSNIVWVNGFNGSGYGQFLKAHSRTQNGGATWTAGTYSGFGTYIKACVLTGVTYNKAFCVAIDTVTSAASFWQTVNGGSTWSLVTGIMNTGTTTFADGVKFWDSSKGFCYGDPVSGEFDIYTTNDGGTTWTDVPAANIPNPLSTAEYGFNGNDCAQILPGGIGFFLTNFGRVYKTTDYGTTWVITPTNPFPTTTAFGSNKMYASSADYIICAVYTTSTTSWSWMYIMYGGTTWSAYTPYYDYAMCYVPWTTNTFVATSPNTSATVGVAHSEDGGWTWADYMDATYLQPAGSNIQCLGVAFYNNGIGWVGNYDQAQSINSILKYHKPITGDDAGISAIVQPTGLTNVGTSVQVIVTIRNYGTTTLTSIPLSYKVGSGTPVTETWTGSLASGATANYTFTATFIGPDASYNLCAYTSVSGDVQPGNDQTCVNMTTNSGIDENSANQFVLSQNFPNPAKDFTEIGFTVAKQGEVVLNVMNEIGSIVYTETKTVDAGPNKFTLNTSGLKAGIYVYEFEFAGSRSYKKMIIF